jgi:hypothetical protein
MINNTKYILICLCLLFMMLPDRLSAQGDIRDSLMEARFGRNRPARAIIKTSPFAIFYWQIPMTGEYRLNGELMSGKKHSLSAGASYLTRSLFLAIAQSLPANKGAARVGANGYRVQGAYRYYLLNKPFRPEGLYVSLHASFASVKFNFKDYPDDYQLLQHFNLNLLVGGQLIIANRVSLELFLGPGYKNNAYISRCRPGYEPIDTENLFPMLRKHFKFNLGMNIGIVL